MNTKVVLIQVNLSPYRIPLFEKLGEYKEIDFTLALMAKDKPTYPSWKYDFESFPFKVKLVHGLCLKLPSLSQICINPRIFSFLYNHKPDVVFCCGFTASTLLSLIYSLFSDAKIVIWMEGNKITEEQRSFAGFRNVIRQFMARKADGFISAGQRSEEYIQSLLPTGHEKKIITSYNAVDTKKISADAESFRSDPVEWPIFRERYPERNLLFSGRLVEIKGIDRLLDAYEKVLKKTGERIGLVMLGEGPLRTDIEKTIRDRGLDDVYLEGFIEQDEYPRYFALAEMFVLLSLLDCNPLVIFEALSCGLPVICSNRVGNAPDFVENDVNGFIVNPDDIDGIADRIIEILYSKNISDMREASKTIVKKSNYDDSAQAFVDMVKLLKSS
jgi:glycosyltransferase involved in cell wall biosynthesis